MHSTVKTEEPAVYLEHIFTYGRKGKAQATTLFSLSVFFFFFTQLYVLKNGVACDAPSEQVENSTHAKGTTCNDQPCRFLNFLKHDCIYLLQYNYTNL